MNQNREDIQFEVGDLLILLTRNLPLRRERTKKFSPKYIGPFTITEKLASGRAYRLELPSEYKHIHPTFNISLLKKFREDYSAREASVDTRFAISHEKKATIEKILAHRIRNSEVQFLVSFRDSSPIENTWVNKQEVDYQQEIIEEYFKNLFEDR